MSMSQHPLIQELVLGRFISSRTVNLAAKGAVVADFRTYFEYEHGTVRLDNKWQWETLLDKTESVEDGSKTSFQELQGLQELSIKERIALEAAEKKTEDYDTAYVL